MTQNKIDLCRSIKVPKFRKAKFPELMVFVRIKRCVVSAECGTPIVAHPYIEAIVNHFESRSHIRVMDHPSSRATEKPMLKKHNWSTFNILSWPFDSID